MADDPTTETTRACDDRCATGPGWFWTRTEWSDWSNTLALLLPEHYDGDEAQEAIIERALTDLVRQVEDVHVVLDEYEAADASPAPYTNERALYERICSALGRAHFARPERPGRPR